jgi:hypothetical protein
MPFIILIIFIFAGFLTRTQQPVIITDFVNASSTGKIFTILLFNHFSSLALTPYLLVAEETLVSSFPHHD